MTRCLAYGGRVTRLRALFMNRRHLALAVLLAAVLAKALVPAGYMVGASNRVLTVLICADSLGEQQVRHIVVPSDHDVHEAGTSGDGSAKAASCGFSVLGFGALSPIEPAILMAAIAFALALGFGAVVLPPARRSYRLVPPLRGPPHVA